MINFRGNRKSPINYSMNILVFHPEIDKARILSFALESHLGFQVRQANALESAFALLLGEQPVDLVVICENEKTPLLLKYLSSFSTQIPVILLGSVTNLQKHEIGGVTIEAQLTATGALAQLPTLIKDRFRIDSPPAGVEANYCRINVELLLKVVPLKGDVYLRLSSLKFVKMYNAGTTFTDRDLERIWGLKKIDYLYIEKSSAPEFVSRLEDNLLALALSAQEGDESQLLTLTQVQETIQGLAAKIGVTDEVVKLTNVQMDLALKVIGTAPKLNKVISATLSNKQSYLAIHSVQVAHVACCIAGKLEWPSNVTFKKLIFAAFVHDIALSNAEHAKIKTKNELLNLRGQLTASEYNAIEKHMLVAGDIANRFSQLPSDVCQIILQHHELPDGSGFPRGISAFMIAPLSTVFIIAHEMVDAMLTEGKSFRVEKFWHDNADAYSAGTFKKVLRAFISSTESEAA